ncbi:unnamed protein product, partial [Staurois parvus]
MLAAPFLRGDIYTLMISVAPSVPPVKCPSVHINATYQCPSQLPFSANYQCSQCHLSVPYMSTAFQCPPVMPVNAHQCSLSVPIT